MITEEKSWQLLGIKALKFKKSITPSQEKGKYYFFGIPIAKVVTNQFNSTQKVQANKDNNHIYLVSEDKKREVNSINGVNVHFLGKDSVLELYEPLPKFKNVNIHLKNNSFVSIGSSKHKIENAELVLTASSCVKIGQDFSCAGMYISNRDEKGISVTIGDDCMFSADIYIRTSDGHTIYDETTKKVLNKPEKESVVIGNHVWLGNGATILKGTRIPNNSIVGKSTLVNKKFDEDNVILAGVPASIVKRNINWKREHTDYFPIGDVN